MRPLHSPEAVARDAAAIADFHRSREGARLRDTLETVARETVDAQQNRTLMRVAHEKQYSWIVRRLRRWLGITADLARIADATNGRFSDVWTGERGREAAILELTDALNAIATRLNALESAR